MKKDSELGQAYVTLKALFDQTKKIYSQHDCFLSADHLNIQKPEHRAIIRITNLAVFVAGALGGDIGFYELDEHFVESFTPEGEALSREHGQLFLSLKTQMYAASQEEQQRYKEEVLDELLPLNIDDILPNRDSQAPVSESELEFMAAVTQRRTQLLTIPTGRCQIHHYHSCANDIR